MGGGLLEVVDVLTFLEGEEFDSLSELSKQAVVICESFEEGLALEEWGNFIVDFGGAVLGEDLKVGDEGAPSILLCPDFLG